MSANPTVLKGHVELYRQLIVFPLIDRLHRLQAGLLPPRLRPDGLIPMTPTPRSTALSSTPSSSVLSLLATPASKHSSSHTSVLSVALTSTHSSAVKRHKISHSPSYTMITRSRRGGDTLYFELDASGKTPRLLAAPRQLPRTRGLRRLRRRDTKG